MPISCKPPSPTFTKGAMPVGQAGRAFEATTKRGRLEIPRLKFSLIEELGQDHKRSENFEVGELTVQLQNWVYAELSRQIATTRHNKNDAAMVCVKKALRRFEAREPYHFYERLSRTCRSTAQRYNDQDDFDEVDQLCTSFPFVVDHNHAGKTRRTFRASKSEIAELCAVSTVVGFKTPGQAAEIFLIDGLRSQPEIIHGDLMDKTINDLCYRFDKRLRRLVANLTKVYDLELCDAVMAIIDEIEEWGGL